MPENNEYLPVIDSKISASKYSVSVNSEQKSSILQGVSGGSGIIDLTQVNNDIATLNSQIATINTNKANISALTNYYTKAEADTLLGNKASITTLSNYYTSAQIDTLLGNKTNISVLSSYYTKTETTTLLGAYVTSTSLSTALGNYYLKSEADTLLSGKVNTSTLTSYYTKTEADTLLGNKVNTSTLSNYYTSTQTDTLLNNKANSSTLSNYYTSAQTDTLLNNKVSTTVHQQDIDTKANKTDTIGKDTHFADMLWTDFAYNSGWSDFSTPGDVWDTGKFTLTNQGELIIQGLIKKATNGSNGEIINSSVLPIACRPTKNKFAIQYQWTGSVGKTATILVNTAGEITYGGATGDAVSYLTISASIPVQKKVVGLIGDSITAGSGVSVTANRYSTLFANAIGHIEDNIGISGTVLQNTDNLANNMQDRFIADVLRRYVKLIVINGGLNDLRYNGANFTVAKYQASLTAMVTEALKYYSGEQIIICSPPMMNPSFFNTNPPYNAGSTLKQQQYRDAAKAVALSKKCKFVDVYQYMVDNGGTSLVSNDGIHPNDNGHIAIKNALMTAAIPYV